MDVIIMKELIFNSFFEVGVVVSILTVSTLVVVVILKELSFHFGHDVV